MLNLSNKKKYFYQLQINQKEKEIGVSLIKACNYFFKYMFIVKDHPNDPG